MPYYRRRRPNRFNRRIRYEQRRRPGASSATRKVARGKKATTYDVARIASDVVKYGSMVAGLAAKVNSELKHFDKTLHTGAMPTIGWTAPVAITDVPQGDTDQTRDGDSILLKKLQINGLATVNASATICTKLRFVIFKRAVNQIAPVANEYAVPGIFTYRDLDETSYYQTVYDKVHTLAPSGVAGSTSQKVLFDINIPFDMHVVYETSTTDGGAKNALYWMAIQDDSTNAPNLELISRIRFYDN